MTVSVTPFVRPSHPGPLVVPPRVPAYEQQRLREQHKDRFATARECTNVENSLKQQIVSAMEPGYTEALKNQTTNKVERSIPDIFTHLFDNYGLVETEEVISAETTLQNKQYLITTPIHLLYKEIEDFNRLALAARIPYSPAQLKSIALHILRNRNEFEDDLRTWYQRPAADQTWVNLKTHFADELRQLQKIRGKGLQSASFQQANALAEQVTDSVVSEINTVKSSIQALLNAQTKTPIIDNHTNQENIPPEEYDNAAVHRSNVTNADLLSAFKDLKKEVADMKNQNRQQRFPRNVQPWMNNFQQQQNYTPWNHNQQPFRPWNNNSNNNRYQPFCPWNNNNTPPNVQQWTNNNNTGWLPCRLRKKKYCWTHGNCAHDSKECNSQAPGHKTEATFQNKMGVNKTNCEYCT